MSGIAAVVGGGGREFVVGEALAASQSVSEIAFLPGNAGTDGVAIPGGFNINEKYLVGAITALDPDLVFVGPEAPLIAGLADELDAAGFRKRLLGIRQETAFLEGSKVEADKFMEEFGILRPPSRVVTTWDDAIAATANRDPKSYVLKADKPAQGKGVVLPHDQQEAEETMHGMLSGELFGGAGQERFQVQDRWHGPEVSVFAVSDGKNYYVIPFFSQDHKRLLDGDEGPNTGGMGAYAPYMNLTPRQYEKIYESIDRTYNGLNKRGLNAKGLLYFSYMLAEEAGEVPGFEADDPALIEYNIRFGDPEAQPVIPLLGRAGVDVYDLFRSAADGSLRPEDYAIPGSKVLSSAALSVCLAATGYPDNPRKGDEIFGLDNDYTDAVVHYAGVGKNADRYVTAGGRVLYLTGFGQDTDTAAANAYAAIGHANGGVHFDGMQYRKDIGHQSRKAV